MAVCAVSVGVTALRDPSHQLSDQPTGDQRISSYLQTHTEPKLRNLSAFVIHDGHLSFGGLGTDADDEFEIASVTKTFTAELLRKQLTTGEITLSTTVAEVFGSQVAGSPVAHATVQELAEHTSGLPKIGAVNLKQRLAPFIGANPYADISIKDVLSLARQATLSDRGEYAYSNLGYALLGHMLAENRGVPYATLLQEDILDPLGMSKTYLMEPGSVDSMAPRGGETADRPAEAWEMQGFLSAAGLRSNPRDMAVYAQHLLAGGLPEFTWAHNEHTEAHWHDGQSFGFGAILTVDPSTNTAAFIVADTPQSVAELGLALHANVPQL